MNHESKKNAILLLKDGTFFEGKSIGIEGTAVGEICFNTGMTGYQEIFTDPSYFGQIMITTNAHIGNYGINSKEQESDTIKISGLVCRNFSFDYSRENADESLLEYFKKQNFIAISDVDTRALVRYIRDKGAMNAVISTETDLDILRKKLDEIPAMEGLELASQVSTKKVYTVGNKNASYKIAALDIGIKQNIINNLVKRDCLVKVFPYNGSW
jgi:carbamoyl-phosphate synthase small subunit